MINVEWDTSDFIEVTNKDIQDVENQLGIKFPLDYIAVIKNLMAVHRFKTWSVERTLVNHLAIY